MLKKRFVMVALGLILIGGVLFTLEKTGITNLYSKDVDTPEETDDKRSSDDFDYTPATDTDNDDINSKKEDGSLNQTPNTPDKDTDINIVLIASSQDSAGGPLVIRSQVYGIISGTCNLSLTNGNTIRKSTSVELQNTTYSCRFDVPKNELSNGNWNIKLEVVTEDGRHNEVTTTTTIN